MSYVTYGVKCQHVAFVMQFLLRPWEDHNSVDHKELNTGSSFNYYGSAVLLTTSEANPLFFMDWAVAKAELARMAAP